MGELLGIPEWLAISVFVACGWIIWLSIGFIAHRRGQRRLAAKRPNPTREEFMGMLSDSVDEDIAVWLWDQALIYYDPLTPHPEDHLIRDAMIDDDDIGMDWWPQFARANGLNEKAWPEWPQGWDLTARNYARWLQLARNQNLHPTQRQIPAGT